jgi:ABC-type protease/lipase transport system fused ATPase/permease subunit
MAGEVLLDGRSIHDWPSEDRGTHVGYLPQHVELLPGTIAQNIVRFVEDGDPQDLFAAARRAGAHDAILSLPDGYDSLIGPGGIPLSAGQAKLIGLARALYGEPPLLLLDEPTAHLDQAASNALIASLGELVEAGALAIVSTHDPALLRRTGSVLVVHDRTLRQAAPETLLAPVPAVSTPAKMEKRA